MIARLLKFPTPPQKDGKESQAARTRRPELSAEEREFLPALLEIQETPPPAYQRWLIWSLLVLLALLLLWSTLGKLDVVSTAPGRFIPDGRIKVVQVTETAIVRAIHVKEGQQVKQGDLLLELDPTLAAADLHASGDEMTHNQLDGARLQAELLGQPAHYGAAAQGAGLQVALEEGVRQANQAAYQDKLNTAHTQVSEKQDALAAATMTLNKLSALKDIAQQREQDSRALLEQGFIARVEYQKDQESRVSAEQDFAAQQQLVAGDRQALQEAQQQVAQIESAQRADVFKELNQNIADRVDLQGRFAKAQELHALKWLRAPVSGYVQSVSVSTTGGVVTPAENLVTIVPQNTTLLVEATLSNDDIGYVKVGQPVEIKVDTYPFQKYGALHGTLAWISPDAEQANDSNNPSGEPKPNPDADSESKAPRSYRVHIAVQPGSQLRVNGQTAQLKAGMSVQADIVTDRRRIYEFFLSPLVKYLNDGVHVR